MSINSVARPLFARSRAGRFAAFSMSALLGGALLATGVGLSAANAIPLASLDIHLTSASGATVSGASVELVKVDSGTPNFLESASADPVSGKPGLYEATGLEPGQYAVDLSGTSAVGTSTQWLGGVRDADASQLVTVNSGGNVVDVSYAASGLLSGKVTNSAGKGVGGVCMNLWTFNGSSWEAFSGGFECYATTNSAGNYSFNPGAAGSYKLEFNSFTSTKYIDQFSNGATSVDDAAPIFLGAGKSAVVNTKLIPAATITGRLADVANHGLELELETYRLTGNPTDGFTAATLVTTYGATQFTASDGSFEIDSLPTGYYALRYFDWDRYGIPGGYIGGDTALDATPLGVTAGHTTQAATFVVSTPTPALHSVTASVTDDSSAPLTDLGIGAFKLVSQSDGVSHHFSNAGGGDYVSSGIPDGSYVLEIDVVDSDTGENIFEPYLSDPIVVDGADYPLSVQLDPPTALAFTSDAQLSDADATVGVPITVDPGAVNLSNADSTIGYQWYITTDGDRRPIRGAISAAYTPTGADYGHILTARVTQNYNLVGPNGTVYSTSVSELESTTDGVAIGAQIQNSLAPSIANPGDSQVGDTLHVDGGVWSTAGVQLSYTWSNSSIGVISGANSSSYTLQPTDYGWDVWATVTANKDGWAPSDGYNTDTVTATSTGPIRLVTAPKLTSKTVAGVKTFFVSQSKWSPSPDTLTYDWSVDGVEVEEGVNLSSYPDTAAPGTSIAVRITADRQGHSGATWDGVAVKGTHPGLTVNVLDPDPVAAPDAETVGTHLSANYLNDVYPDSTAPVSTSYQWQRKTGSKWSSISGAKHATYTVAASDAGHALRVAVTPVSPGYVTTVIYGVAGIGTLNTALNGVGVVLIPGSRTLGGVLTTSLSGFLPGVTHTYLWQYSNDSGSTWLPVPKGTKSTLTLTAPLVPGDLVQVQVTSSKSGTAPATITSSFVTVDPNTVESLLQPTLTPQVAAIQGATLTAGAGAWSPTPTKLNYTWWRQFHADAPTPISGASSKTYKTTAEDVGDQVFVQVTAQKTGFATSAATDSPEVFVYSNAVKPALTPAEIDLGDVSYGTPVPAPPVQLAFGLPPDYAAYTKVSYLWKLGGKAISGATHASYTPKTTDVGKVLTLTMTLTSPIYPKSVIVSDPATVGVADNSWYSASVGYSGSLAPGTVLTATTPVSKSTFTWQSSSDNAHWTNIAGATKSTYKATAGDIGHWIRVEATLVQAGYASITQTPQTTDPVQYLGSIASMIAPTLKTAPQVGVTESVNTGLWNLSGLSFGYSWLLDGVPIPGATSATFTPIGYQAAGELSVTVTASRTGYQSATVTSDARAILVGATPTIVHKPAITGTPTVCSALAVSSSTWSVSGVTVSYQWNVGGTPVDGETGATFLPEVSDNGSPVSVTLTTHAIGYPSATYTTAPTADVAGCV